MNLTYRTNKSGELQAAYCGLVRIGYVECSKPGRWVWTLNMLQPLGGRATGITVSEETAKAALRGALVDWVKAAGLEFAS